MLIITRKIGEVILLNEDIFIKILHIKGNQVNIGIDAPNDIIIKREELLYRDGDIISPNVQSKLNQLHWRD